jgi:ribosomal protein S18 acetylase RimI-like enzyme
VPSGAVDDIDARENIVWVYFDEYDEAVGFGAIGPAVFVYPDVDGADVEHLQIVYAGVDFHHRGRGYFKIILSDLLAEAHDRSPAPIVTLFVDSKNRYAREIYERDEFGFMRLPYLDEYDPVSGLTYLAMATLVRDAAETQPRVPRAKAR